MMLKLVILGLAFGALLCKAEKFSNEDEIGLAKYQRQDYNAPPVSCSDRMYTGAKISGVYQIGIRKADNSPFFVYCDQTTDGGGWAVIQRRQDGSVNFNRGWADYKVGFGDQKGEYWLGLENIHLLTKSARNELRVDVVDYQGNTAYAKYELFSIGDEQSGYKLSVGPFSTRSTAGDSLTYHNGMKFSTNDRDNDGHSPHCGKNYGAWWHKSCHYSNLNGPYFCTKVDSAVSVSWYHWKNKYVSVKKAQMMIRPLLH